MIRLSVTSFPTPSLVVRGIGRACVTLPPIPIMCRSSQQSEACFWPQLLMIWKRLSHRHSSTSSFAPGARSSPQFFLFSAAACASTLPCRDWPLRPSSSPTPLSFSSLSTATLIHQRFGQVKPYRTVFGQAKTTELPHLIPTCLGIRWSVACLRQSVYQVEQTLCRCVYGSCNLM
jgi:hypothetical protein